MRSLRPKPHMKKLKWERVADGFIERVEPACARINDKLYVFAGYRTLDEVVQSLQVLDLTTGKWEKRLALPKDIPQTHQGVEGDGARYIYHVSGQDGVQCHPAVVRCYSFDTQEETWHALPDLPQPRYAAAVRLWKGRLHVLAGSEPDRVSPASDHWSLAVKDGKALKDAWRAEVPIPRGGPHRSTAIVNDELYVLAGQEGDRPPVAGDPCYACDWTYKIETFYGDSFALNTTGEWRRLADMPLPATHAEYSTFVVGHEILVLGGLIPGKCLTDDIQAYDTLTDEWKMVGKLPWRNKGCVAAFYDG